MLKLRIVTACILGCMLLAGLFLLNPDWTALGFGIVLTAGAWEWAGFGGLQSLAARAAYTSAIAVLLVLSWRWTEDPAHLLALLALACVWWLAAFLWLVVAPVKHRPRLALLCGIPVLVPAFVALGRLDRASGEPMRGPAIVLWLVLLVIAADIGAFFVGRSLGKRKLAPRVSPGKTWEGALGGLAAVALVAWGGVLWLAGAAVHCVRLCGRHFFGDWRSDGEHVQAVRRSQGLGRAATGTRRYSRPHR
jgi:phosphatidate cytidylyltransferase